MSRNIDYMFYTKIAVYSERHSFEMTFFTVFTVFLLRTYTVDTH